MRLGELFIQWQQQLKGRGIAHHSIVLRLLQKTHRIIIDEYIVYILTSKIFIIYIILLQVDIIQVQLSSF